MFVKHELPSSSSSVMLSASSADPGWERYRTVGKEKLAKHIVHVVVQAWVGWKLDNAILPGKSLSSMVCFVNTYPLDSNLSGG